MSTKDTSQRHHREQWCKWDIARLSGETDGLDGGKASRLEAAHARLFASLHGVKSPLVTRGADAKILQAVPKAHPIFAISFGCPPRHQAGSRNLPMSKDAIVLGSDFS